MISRILGGVLFILAQGLRVALAAQPSADAVLADSGGEGFIEIGVAADEQASMGQLVEDEFGQLGIAAVDEGVQHGIGEEAQG